MERHVDMKEISDGRKYRSSDMAKLGCNDCEGCSVCCRNTGTSIVLDPWDIYMLTTHLECSFESLLQQQYLELNVIEGMILPNIKVEDHGAGCHFLKENGRCGIHAFRPGFCRLFPLGRLYEEQSFTYFLQTQECKKERRTKVKISKWLDIPDLARYERFVAEWHYFLKNFQKNYRNMSDEALRKWNLFLLQTFFAKPYEKEDFYQQFAERMETGRKEIRKYGRLV